MIAGIVLAAGAAERMGQPKQLLPWGAETVLGSVLASATAALERVVVVLGAAAEAIQARVNLHGATVVLHPDYYQGQASSLLAGLRALEAQPEVEAVMVLLGDQPTVRLEVMQRMVNQYALAQGSCNALVPNYGGRQGNPVVFARAAWPVLQRGLSGDGGARALLARGEVAPLCRVDLPAEWWPEDIDTWEDYARLRAQCEK